MYYSLLFLCMSVAWGAKLGAESHQHHHPLPEMTEEQKEDLIQELEDAQMLKELEILIKNLDDEQLDKLETILVQKDTDHSTEFGMIMTELKSMGVDDEDIEDLKQLASLMNEFLVQVPLLEEKLEMKGHTDLLDNIQLYLLGLPNKLGPLGFIALHHVLDSGDDDLGHGDIVDVVLEPSSVEKIERMVKEKAAKEKAEDIAPTFRRKRSISSIFQTANTV